MSEQQTRGAARKGAGAALLVVVAAVAWAFDLLPAELSRPERPHASPTTVESPGGLEIEAAYAARRSGLMARARGIVAKRLADDRDGSRHQRFIIELASGHTVLVAHNIDLAERVPLSEGDAVEVLGQYEWNERGGVLHWTHHDPEGRHAEGWIRHAGSLYE